jgi:hypothetical protein
MSAKGIVAILTDPKGRVVASVSDFTHDGYGGFSLQEAQEHRVKRHLAFAVIRAYCSDFIIPAIEPYDCEQIVARLTRQHGFTRTLIPIGHAEEKA